MRFLMFEIIWAVSHRGDFDSTKNMFILVQFFPLHLWEGPSQWAQPQDKYKYNYTEEFWAMPDTIKAKDSTAIAETIENYFLSGEVDKIEIAYSRLGLGDLYDLIVLIFQIFQLPVR